jgi:hypothetical protein
MKKSRVKQNNNSIKELKPKKKISDANDINNKDNVLIKGVAATFLGFSIIIIIIMIGVLLYTNYKMPIF